MENVAILALALAAVTAGLLVVASLLARALRLERVRVEELRSTAEGQRSELLLAKASAESVRDRCDAERGRAEQLDQALQATRNEGERRVETIRQEATDNMDRARAALSELRSRCASQAQQIIGLEQRAAELIETQAERDQLRDVLSETREQKAKLQTQLEEERRSAAERLKLQDELHGQLEEKFKGLAAQVLERNTEKFESSTKLRLEEMGEAFRRHVKELREKVEQTHHTDTSDRIALRTELARMVSASQRIDQDAANLTRALTGDRRAQGAWGELVLERVLEQSGLREGTEYERQRTVNDDEGRRLRPDVIVRLPGARSVVVDAKVSLTAYTEYASAADDAACADALARHLTSLRSHIRQLSDKAYWQANELKVGDYVLMFVAVESAMAEALRSDPTLFEEASRQHVILTSPSMLLATLRTIEHTWQVERQSETARTIVEQAGKLYDKFEGFVGDLQGVGDRLKQAQIAYDGALNKLSSGRGNLVRKAEQLRNLGLKVKKELPSELVDNAVAGILADASTAEPSLAEELEPANGAP